MIFFYLPLSPWRFSPFVGDNLVYHVAAFTKAQKMEILCPKNCPFFASIVIFFGLGTKKAARMGCIQHSEIRITLAKEHATNYAARSL